MERIVREIELELEAIEGDNTLYEEDNFGSRLEALDTLEVDILEQVEGLLAADSEAQTLVALKRRAELVQGRLETTNEKLFSRLRAGIRSGDYRGTELRRQLEPHAGWSSGGRGQDDGAYDSLDALISGLLLVGAAPARTAPRESEMVFYQPTPVRIILELVERAGLEEHDTFYDLGSGLGQVVILVHLLSGVPAKGVEVDPAYCEYARRCARALNLSGVDFINVDARVADTSDGTVFFLYTPFEGKMLQEVLEKLRGAAEERSIRVYTYGPCTPEVSRQDWLKYVGSEARHTHSLAAFISIRDES